MITEKCCNCGKSIKDKRKGTKYCSDTCKQKAYQARKEGEAKGEKTNSLFYLEDFLHIQNIHWEWYFDGTSEKSDLDIPTYCFLMQHGNVGWTLSQKEDYILGFCKNKSNCFDAVRDSQAFKRFKEEFLSGKYRIISNKENAPIKKDNLTKNDTI